MTGQLFEDLSLDTITVSRGQFAGVFDVSMSLVSELISKGIVAEDHRGVNLVQGVRAVYRHQRRGGESTLEAERKKLLAVKTAREELELARRRKGLIPAEEVKRQAAGEAIRVRDALEAIPARLAPILAAEGDTLKVRELLGSEIKIVLRELSRLEDE